jgi:hypothetical protein
MSHHDKDFSTLETVDLEHVTGGAGGDSMSMMLPMMMMMRGKHSAAPAAAPAPPPRPKILLNGVEQQPTTGADGGLAYNSEV